MLEKMFLIVFAITIWEYREEISKSIFSVILIILAFFSNLSYNAKTRMRIKKARKKRTAEKIKDVIGLGGEVISSEEKDNESIEEPGGSATLMQKWESKYRKDKSNTTHYHIGWPKAMMKRWWPDDS